MTETEWLACNDLRRLSRFVRRFTQASRTKRGRRKFHLFTSACFRTLIWAKADKQSRRLVELIELFADGLITRQELDVAQDKCLSSARLRSTNRGYIAFAVARAASQNVTAMLGSVQVNLILLSEGSEKADRRLQCRLFRDIFNPFLHIKPAPSWLTPTVTGLAESIYQERAFDRLPILADALEDAGCANADILNHCRQPGEHVRGCWVIDLLLGKS